MYLSVIQIIQSFVFFELEKRAKITHNPATVSMLVYFLPNVSPAHYIVAALSHTKPICCYHYCTFPLSVVFQSLGFQWLLFVEAELL